jgi:hypothetical protein
LEKLEPEDYFYSSSLFIFELKKLKYMLGKDLKELVKDIPDDIQVLVMAPHQPELGGFAFVEACKERSGIVTLGPSLEDDPDSGEAGPDVFVLVPHGATATQDELEEMEGKPNPTKDN